MVTQILLKKKKKQMLDELDKNKKNKVEIKTKSSTTSGRGETDVD